MNQTIKVIPTPLPPHVLDAPAINSVFHISRSQLFKKVADGEFPQPVRLGGKANLWLYDEVLEWFRNSIEAERKGVA